MTAAVPTPWPRVRAVLADAGISPRDVRERGVTVHGYWDRGGVWQAWPEGVGAQVLDARRADLLTGEGRDTVPVAITGAVR